MRTRNYYHYGFTRHGVTNRPALSLLKAAFEERDTLPILHEEPQPRLDLEDLRELCGQSAVTAHLNRGQS